MMINSTKTKKPGKILIVDDSLDNLKFLAEMLKGYGYIVIEADNVKRAINKAELADPDLILLDIVMPGMDGYQFCESLKSHPKTVDIPVIFLSGLDELFDKIKAFKVGGVDYISKPFKIEEVVARIENQLTLKRQKIELAQEIERRQHIEEILCESRSLLASVLNSSPDGIAAFKAVRDQDEKIAYFRCVLANRVIAKMVSQHPDNLVGQRVLKTTLDRLDPNLFEQLVQVVETGESLNQEFRFELHNTQHWYSIIVVKNGEGFSMTIRDVSERKEWELLLNQTSQNLYQQAISDSLTKVANRRAFDHYIELEWQRSKREQVCLSMILADIDYFKNYNDHYGHQAGDECLRKIAQAIRNAVKRPADFVARYGGEEFAIILPNTEMQGAKQVAGLIHSEIHQLQVPHAESDVSQYVTLSMGVASRVPQVEDSFHLLIGMADAALYEAKRQGRDRIVEAENL